MASRYKKKKSSPTAGWLYSIPTILVLLIVTMLVGRATWGAYQKQAITAQKLHEVQSEQQDLKSRIASARTELKHLESRAGTEAELRQSYNIAKPNEYVVVLVEEESGTTATTTDDEKSWWERLRFW